MREPVTECRVCKKSIDHEATSIRIDEPNTKACMVKPRWFERGKRKPFYDALCWKCILWMMKDCIPK